jgi:uncharacterized protein
MLNLDQFENIALAFDGGGVRGIITAHAIRAVEEALGVERLIDSPKVRVIAGTSTGAIIATAVALGMTSAEIGKFYQEFAADVFPRYIPFPPYSLDKWFKKGLGVFIPAVYRRKPYEKHLNRVIEDHGKKDMTLGDLGKYLQSLGDKPNNTSKVMVINTINVHERRTKFLKSCGDKDAGWKLAEAVIASSAAPFYLPVLKRSDDKGGRVDYYVDGGLGSFNNPAYVAALEAVGWQDLPSESLSVLSFGTGWYPTANFRQSNADPSWWRVITWAQRAIDLLMDEAARAQSLDVLHDFAVQKSEIGKINFRRFQIKMPTQFMLDDSRPSTMNALNRLGEQLVDRIQNGDYFSSDRLEEIANRDVEEPDIDPEGIAKAWLRYNKSMEASVKEAVKEQVKENLKEKETVGIP